MTLRWVRRYRARRERLRRRTRPRPPLVRLIGASCMAHVLVLGSLLQLAVMPAAMPTIEMFFADAEAPAAPATREPSSEPRARRADAAAAVTKRTPAPAPPRRNVRESGTAPRAVERQRGDVAPVAEAPAREAVAARTSPVPVTPEPDDPPPPSAVRVADAAPAAAAAPKPPAPLPAVTAASPAPAALRAPAAVSEAAAPVAPAGLPPVSPAAMEPARVATTEAASLTPARVAEAPVPVAAVEPLPVPAAVAAPPVTPPAPAALPALPLEPPAPPTAPAAPKPAAVNTPAPEPTLPVRRTPTASTGTVAEPSPAPSVAPVVDTPKPKPSVSTAGATAPSAPSQGAVARRNAAASDSPLSERPSAPSPAAAKPAASTPQTVGAPGGGGGAPALTPVPRLDGGAATASAGGTHGVRSSPGLGLIKPRVELHGPRTRVTERESETVSGRITAGSPTRLRIYVNDTAHDVTGGGAEFRATIPLALGVNRIRAVVVDVQGQEAEDGLSIDFVRRPPERWVKLTSPVDGQPLVSTDPPAVVVEGQVSDGTPRVWVVAGDVRVPVAARDGRFRTLLPVLRASVQIWAETDGPDVRRSDPVTVAAPNVPPAAAAVVILTRPGERADVRVAWRARADRPEGPTRPVTTRTFATDATGASLHLAYVPGPPRGVYTIVAPGGVAAATLYLATPDAVAARPLARAQASLVAKVLYPEGVLWDDDDWFTGKSEGSDTVTKFRLPDGVTWTERKSRS